jgi:hypothetical protein
MSAQPQRLFLAPGAAFAALQQINLRFDRRELAA